MIGARMFLSAMCLTGLLSQTLEDDALFLTDRLADHYETFNDELKVASIDDLGLKKRSSDLSLSIAASWELAVRRRESLEVPVDIKRFCGFVEGRLNVEIPEFWRTLVQEIDIRRQRFVWIDFNGFRRNLKETQFGFYCPTSMIVSKDDGSYTFLEAESEIRLPENAVKSYPLVTVSNIDSNSDTTIMAVYEQGQDSYEVYAKSGMELKWSSTGVAGGNPVLSSGPGRLHFVEVRIVDDRVFVFGIANDCAHINAFDLSTGDPLFRFSTGWFYDR